jgi:hypothetical protein
LYAQVVKQREKGRVVAITRKSVFGSPAEIDAYLATSPTSTVINTSFVERDNLTWREHNRRLTRKTTAFAKERSWFEKPLWLSPAYYHFCCGTFVLLTTRDSTVVALAGLLSFLLPPCQLAPTFAEPRTNPRHRIATKMATDHPDYGCWHYRSYLDHN